MSNGKSCENCAETEDCGYGLDDDPFEGDCSAWTPMRCRCGGILSAPREHNGKKYRHCFACHFEFFEEENA